MESFQINDLSITLDKEGAREFSKVSYPIRYGRFGEIKTPHHLFQFNLNGEIKYVQGRGRGWPHPAEWLKRTTGNDWIYYSSGDPSTLAALRKPISAEKVRQAFSRMLDINKRYENIEVTANFVFGKELPVGHLPSLFELTQGRLDPLSIKGAIYLSPLIGVKIRKEVSKREILRSFKEVKAQSPLPTYIYLIQRL